MDYKKTLAQRAKELGISISALKHQEKQKRDEAALRKAYWDAFMPKSSGWNPKKGKSGNGKS